MTELERLAQLNTQLSNLELDSAICTQIINSLPDGLIIIDESAIIKLATVQVELMFGYPSAMLVGNKVHMLLDPETATVHAKHIERFFDNPVVRPMNFAKALSGKHKNGKTVTVQISIGPLVSSQGIMAMALVRRMADGK